MNNLFRGFTLKNFSASLYLNLKLYSKSIPAIVGLIIAIVYMGLLSFTFAPFLFGYIGMPEQSELLTEVSKYILTGGALATITFLLMIVPIPIIAIRRSGFSKRIGNMNISWASYVLFLFLFVIIASQVVLFTYCMTTLIVWSFVLSFNLPFFGIMLNLIIGTILFTSVSIFLGSVGIGIATLFGGTWFNILIGFIYVQGWALLAAAIYPNKIYHDELKTIIYIIDPLLLFVKTSIFSIVDKNYIWHMVFIIPESLLISSAILTSVIKFNKF